MKKIITDTDLENFQYFYPYTVAIVGAKTTDRINFMACAWHTALSFSPPLFGILIAKKRLTYEVIAQAGEFTVNFIPREKIELSAQMGRISGHDKDKVKEFKVALSPGQRISSPILTDAYVALECRTLAIHTCGDHELFVGKVLAVHEEKGSFHADGRLNVEKVNPLLYLGSDYYMTIDPATLEHKLP